MSAAMIEPWLEQVRQAWRGSPAPRFFRWWGAQLAVLLPARWRTVLREGAEWFALEHSDGRWRLRRLGSARVLASWSGRGGESSTSALTAVLAEVDPADRRLVLLLAPEQVLRRRIGLPLAARERLREVAGYELDRQTPFQAAQVHYAVRELEGPAPPGRLRAELVVVPRTVPDPLLARLAEAGLGIDALDVADGEGRLGVNLLPRAQRPRHANPRQRLNLALGVAALVLLGLVLGQWLGNRERALATMQDEVAAMRGEAQAVLALRQQLEDSAGAASFLARRRQANATRLTLLADLTRRLPDSAWIERFNVDASGQLGLQGQAQQAAKLLDALKDSALITDASFQGSIQADPSTGKERFYLNARVRPAVLAPAPAAAVDASPAHAPAADGAPGPRRGPTLGGGQA